MDIAKFAGSLVLRPNLGIMRMGWIVWRVHYSKGVFGRGRFHVRIGGWYIVYIEGSLFEWAGYIVPLSFWGSTSPQQLSLEWTIAAKTFQHISGQSCAQAAHVENGASSIRQLALLSSLLI